MEIISKFQNVLKTTSSSHCAKTKSTNLVSNDVMYEIRPRKQRGTITQSIFYQSIKDFFSGLLDLNKVKFLLC